MLFPSPLRGEGRVRGHLASTSQIQFLKSSINGLFPGQLSRKIPLLSGEAGSKSGWLWCQHFRIIAGSTRKEGS
jgi:hypothetical protein